MRRLALVVVALLLAVVPVVRSDNQADEVAALITALEDSLRTGDVEEFVRRSAPSLPDRDRAWLAAVPGAGPDTAVVLRERGRTSAAVFVEAFVAGHDQAALASWVLNFAPRADSAGIELRSVSEVSRFGSLVRLSLDTSIQYRATNFVITGPDFIVRMPTGTVFLSGTLDRPAAVVLRGRSEIRFTPADPAEQGQMQIFAGAPALSATAADVFVRLNPDDRGRFLSWGGLQPVAVDPADVADAREVFEQRSVLSHDVDVSQFTDQQWSIQPANGSLLVDFRSARDGWLTYSRSPEQPEDVSLFDRARRRQISLYQHDRSRDVRVDGLKSSPVEVRHTVLDLMFDPPRRWLTGRASLVVVLHEPAASIVLRLAEHLVVSSVTSPELGALLPIRPRGYDTLILGLPHSVPAGSTLTLDVTYHGRLDPKSPLDDTTAVTTTTAQEPSPPTLTEFPFILEPRYLFTIGSSWYPHVGTNRHATAAIRLTVPTPYQVVATGDFIAVTTSEPTDRRWAGSPRQVRAFEYHATRPVRYLSTLVSRLETVGRAQATVPSIAATPGSQPASPGGVDAVVEVNVLKNVGQSRPRDTPERVAAIVAFYAGLIGEAPFPSLTVASLEDTTPGGHSPASFVLLTRAHAATPLSWARDPVAFDGSPDFFLAHEIAHQWWGQAVAGRTYHDQWISEGFAQYFAWMYTTSVDGPVAGQRLMARMRSSTEGLEAEGPIRLGYRLGHLRGDRRIHRSIAYNKSAVVLHMLRRLIGDDAFVAGLGRLYATHRFSTVDVEDVRDAFQQGTPLPLDRFFTRWISESAVPQLRTSWRHTPSGGVVIVIEQVGPLFDLPYDVTVRYADGREETTTLAITATAAEVELPARGPVRRVQFDDPLTIARIVR